MLSVQIAGSSWSSAPFVFWAIDKFVNDRRLEKLVKLLVVLICLGAILQRVLPLAGVNWL